MYLDRFPRGIAVVATREGEDLGKRVSTMFPNSYYLGNYTRDIVRRAFDCYDAVVLVMSVPGAVRVTCELTREKGEGPAVIAVDPLGEYVVPILNAHWGANELAENVAKGLGARAVITTLAERRGIKPLELLARELYAELWPKELIVKYYRAVLEGEKICTDFDPPEGYDYLVKSEGCGFRLSFDCRDGELCLRPYSLFLGVGAKPKVSNLKERVMKVLEELRVPKGRVKAVGSVRAEVKEVAEALNAEFRLFTFDELKDFEDYCLSPSSKALDSLGVPGVAEVIALKLAGVGGKLLVRKVRDRDVTVALAGRL